MSPTSYQAAPPRGSTRKLNLRRTESRQQSVLRLLPCSIRDGRIGEPIQDLLLAAYHAEHFARDALLRRRISAQPGLVPLQRIHHVLQGIDVLRQARARPSLVKQVDRAELAALHREDQ